MSQGKRANVRSRQAPAHSSLETGNGKKILVHKVMTPAEIDYERLSEAIIEAHRRLNEKPEEEEHEKVGFWKSVWLILRGKKETNDQLTTGAMAEPLAMIFKMIAVTGFMGIILVVCWCVNYILTMSRTEITIYNILAPLIWSAALVFLFFVYSIALWGAGTEMHRTRDKHFIASVFSGMVSLAALVVALVALGK